VSAWKCSHFYIGKGFTKLDPNPDLHNTTTVPALHKESHIPNTLEIFIGNTYV